MLKTLKTLKNSVKNIKLSENPDREFYDPDFNT